MKHDGHAPLPSERTLFAIWDAIDRVRTRQGETVAQQLARAALAIVSEPGQQQHMRQHPTDPTPKKGTTHATQS